MKNLSMQHFLSIRVALKLLRGIAIFCLLIFAANIQAQNPFLTTKFITTDNVKTSAAPFKAVSFRFPVHAKNQLTVDISGKIFPIQMDEHILQQSNFLMSTLLVFDTWQDEIRIIGIQPGDSIQTYLFSPPTINLSTMSTKTITDSCDLPALIMQEAWRKGLPEPDYERIHNKVSHQIIHHTASSNTITDYLNLVRSIYLFHTEVNGWSDMGYNYLIAPDGSIFAGRDPGDEIGQDEVLGAHFCASNTSTMGISMLGTFDTIIPSAQAMQSLEQLLTWKSAKDAIDPLAELAHPLNENLGTIAGHRDGCSTMCPGESLYNLLSEIRLKTRNNLYDCEIYPGFLESTHSNALEIFPNPVVGNGFTLRSSLQIENIIFYTITGQLIKESSIHRKQALITLPEKLPSGIYMIKVILSNQEIVVRKIQLNNF
ncbi:MAG: N-acetylmuramoyl-L-alanine amidase [Bacteroidetes bacterium]|nr:N-acetylmuramoyl-L-alanine amidase [Bacteroidota bacterium]